jgi:elongation factor 2
LGFDAGLRKASSGAAFCSLSFSHWAVIDSDPLEEGTRANRLMVAKRQLKGLPPLDPAAFIDKL